MQVKGKFFATGHVCTHYNMPLVKGVLAEDGRVTCPYHGACFNVASGDIEDAPGLDGPSLPPAAPCAFRRTPRSHLGVCPSTGLETFKVRIDNGRVFVSVVPKDTGFGTHERPSHDCV